MACEACFDHVYAATLLRNSSHAKPETMPRATSCSLRGHRANRPFDLEGFSMRRFANAIASPAESQPNPLKRKKESRWALPTIRVHLHEHIIACEGWGVKPLLYLF
jgi:hypothetical protein